MSFSTHTPTRDRHASPRLRAVLLTLALACIPIFTGATAPPARAERGQEDAFRTPLRQHVPVDLGNASAVKRYPYQDAAGMDGIQVVSRFPSIAKPTVYLPLLLANLAAADLPRPLPAPPSPIPAAPASQTCTARNPAGNPFAAGPYGTNTYQMAGPFTLATTDGVWDFRKAWTGCDSYMFLLTEHNSSYAKAIWDTSISDLLRQSPENVHYFFLSYAKANADILTDVKYAKNRVDAALAKLPAAEKAYWQPRFHYGTEGAWTAPGWLSKVLEASSEEVPGLTLTWEVGATPFTMQPESFGGRGPWMPKVSQVGTIQAPLAWYGLGCSAMDGSPSAPVQDVKGKIALFERGTCPFYDKIWNAQKQGALAAVIYTTPDRPLTSMGCSAPSDCSKGPAIPAALIDPDSGTQLRDRLVAGTAVLAKLEPAKRGPYYFGIDRLQRYRELGILNFLGEGIGIDHLAYEARYYNWEWATQEHLKAEDDTTIGLFHDVEAADSGWAGVRSSVDITLPSAAEMSQYDTLELELGLRCTGDGRDGNCPPWDYLIYLYVCDAQDNTKCDTEVGRWITAYGRPATYLTDVSPMLALFRQGGVRRFQFYTQQRYKVDLAMHLSNQQKHGKPVELIPLFTGGAFGADYNNKYQPITVTVPADVKRVELMGVISGHGYEADAAQCAEFCNHTHHFKVNGHLYVKDHPDAGTDYGCAMLTGIGVVPNQYGTWHYGRGGWCPGQEVKPWVVDVTSSIVRGGDNVITYRGLFEDGSTWPAIVNPGGFAARIDMVSYLVLHR